jgi:hypothetical protein
MRSTPIRMHCLQSREEVNRVKGRVEPFWRVFVCFQALILSGSFVAFVCSVG